ncbi:hypothetical protein ACQY0O_001270 [Thecaphora frezii]
MTADTSSAHLYVGSSQASGSTSTLESLLGGSSPGSTLVSSASSAALSESLPQRASHHIQALRYKLRRATTAPLSPATDNADEEDAGSSSIAASAESELSTRSHEYERTAALRQQRAGVASNLGPNRQLEGELGIDAQIAQASGVAPKLAVSTSSEKGKTSAPEQQQEASSPQSSSAFLVSYFIAGGAAGATSRTVVSPLERLKIIMQVQPHEKSRAGPALAAARGKGAYSGVWTGLVKMWKEEGFAGFMRGNGINCLRIAPYSAVQFTTYETAKTWLRNSEGELDVLRRLTAGAIAGIASVVSTYPLDLVRSRISIASASMYSQVQSSAATSGELLSKEALRRSIAEKQMQVPGIWEMTVKVYREEGGIRGLYRGCVPTSVGVAPYVALNFVFYEAARKRLAPDGGSPSALGKLACGALAGSISQTVTYPLDVLRRRMQVAGMKDSKLGFHDKNAIDCIKNILKAEGIPGLYRGLLPNLLKVAPSIGTSFLTYEAVRGAIEQQYC